VIKTSQSAREKLDSYFKIIYLHKVRSSAVTNIGLEREEEKRKKLLKHGVLVFGYPAK